MDALRHDALPDRRLRQRERKSSADHDRGAWSLIPDASNSVGRPVAWTGTEVLVGGFACCGELPGAHLTAYNPVSNTWHPLPPSPLTPRNGAVGAWTGREMVLAG